MDFFDQVDINIAKSILNFMSEIYHYNLESILSKALLGS